MICLERLGNTRLPRADRRERLRHPLHELRDGALRARRFAAAGQHVVEDQTERVDIRAVIDRLGHGLLGSHVFQRADHGARDRRACARHRTRDAEIHDDRVVVRVDHDVGWLEIAMDDAGLVRSLQAGDDLTRESRARGVPATVLLA